jgi:hypothetical protein
VAQKTPYALKSVIAAGNTRQKPSRQQTARYLADMLMEMRQLANRQEFKTLQGLLEIAYYEAFAVANPVKLPPGETEALRNLEADARKFAAH